MKKTTLALLIPSLLIGACSKVDDPSLNSKLDINEPPPHKEPVDFSETRNLLWGDLHVHSSLSYDAYTTGVRSMPDDAYHFMKGGTIEHGAGYNIRAHRSLDFGAVTDHSEYLGVPRHLAGESADDSDLPEVLASGNPLKITWNMFRVMTSQMSSADKRSESFDLPGMEQVSKDAWDDIVASAERHNDPGRFTAFIGYEWTSMPGEQNLHRNVIYKDSNIPSYPWSSLISDNPEDLWVELDRQREEEGKQVFAMPHNGNVSNGLMYDSQMFNGGEFNANYAALRNRNEPVSEIFQVKGTSETHPLNSPNDVFADFEIYDAQLKSDNAISNPKGSYIRDALRAGIEFSHAKGFNPYQFGVIGSSDSHNASSSVEEDNFHGKLPIMDGSAGLRTGATTLMMDDVTPVKAWGAAGLAAVWSHENTRASIFEAIERKETYATSGPRMSLRFFAGTDFSEELLAQSDWLQQAYAQGVPMGGKLEGELEQSPVFVLMAAKDPQGANLDRLQVIKGWVDDAGQSHEQIFDVDASDGREKDSSTRLYEPVGSTVNVADASYQNTIGAVQLSAIWRDPEFSPQQQAFYYARVIEIPTPRYSTYDAKQLGIEAPEPASIQERAVSSSIWYQPK